MSEHFILRAANRFRPPYGWLSFGLLAGVLACLALSVLEVEWVVGDGAIVVPPLVLGFGSGFVVARRRVRPALAWSLLIAMGAALAVAVAADLWPPRRVLTTGETAAYWVDQWAFFVDRSAGWLATVRSGGRSTETVVFALGLAAAAWLVAAALAWSVYHARRPYVGLTLVGAALAANTFYGRAEMHWVVMFFGLAVTAGTYLHYLYREEAWEASGTDYSTEVRGELIFYAAGISLGIMSLAFVLPAINVQAIAERFQRQEIVVAAEDTLSRAFAGVAQPRVDEGASGGGGLPRAFLLGGNPELLETVVMTATVRQQAGATEVNLADYHWRSVSYDIYTGRGWLRSAERTEDVDAGEAILPAGDMTAAPIGVIQEVDWFYDRRATRYTVGRPVTFSHDLRAQWRGRDDLVGVSGRNNAPGRYTAESSVVAATEVQLRAVRPEDAPPEIRGRYTALPGTVPARVLALAREVAGTSGGSDGETPPAYDQARAIETFLRQYPYSLDIRPPPEDADVVDYFLFDSQTGFCDYYASAMVVMARAVGLPARLGAGFLPQPADGNGVQTVRQRDAHSWAEIYFAGYGWVEFEPTAPFAVPSRAVAGAATGAEVQPTYEPPGGVTTAMPARAPRRTAAWPYWLGAAALLIVAWRLWGRPLRERFGRAGELDGVQRAYARLQGGAAGIGVPVEATQTPFEFAAELLNAPALAGEEQHRVRAASERLARLFVERQYGGGESGAADEEAATVWMELRAPLRRLAWRRRFGQRQH